MLPNNAHRFVNLVQTRTFTEFLDAPALCLTFIQSAVHGEHLSSFYEHQRRCRFYPPMSPSRSSSMLALAIFAVLLMALEWILLVAGARPHEMFVGAVSVLLSALFLASVKKMSTLKLEFRISDVAQGWRIPGYVLRDSITLTKVLLRDLFLGRRADSLYRASGFTSGKENPCLVARSVLATIYTTTSPNSIVIGIDYKRKRMLFHQLERSAVSAMTRSLGAKS